MQFVLQVNAALHILIRVLLQGGQFELDAFLVLQERTDIVNDSFDVIDRLLQFPYPMIYTGLVLQSSYYQASLNGFSTRSRILKNILSLTEINYRLVVIFLIYGLEPQPVQILQLRHKLIYQLSQRYHRHRPITKVAISSMTLPSSMLITSINPCC